MSKYKFVKTENSCPIPKLTKNNESTLQASKYIKQSALNNLKIDNTKSVVQNTSLNPNNVSKFKLNNNQITSVRNKLIENDSSTSAINNRYIKQTSTLSPDNTLAKHKISGNGFNDPMKYKVRNTTNQSEKPLYRCKNKFKIIKEPTTNSSITFKQVSAATSKLLALRRSNFIRSKNLKNFGLPKVINRYKLTRKSSTSSTAVSRKQNTSFEKNRSHLKVNKYKLNNNPITNTYGVDSCLNNKYIKYSKSSLIANNKKHLASNLIHKSKMTIGNRKNQGAQGSSKSSMGYCLFYNRFGRCSRGSTCSKIHDHKRVALCPRFLRGTCNNDKCPFSHLITAQKMPLCSHYAKGCCSREACPYSHVFYGRDAKVCVRFARDGFCALGENCELAHLNECVEFVSAGKCSKLGTCPFIHRTKKMNPNWNLAKVGKLKKEEQEKKPQNFGDSFIKVRGISLSDSGVSTVNVESVSTKETSPSSSTSTGDDDAVVLKTRPSFMLKKKDI